MFSTTELRQHTKSVVEKTNNYLRWPTTVTAKQLTSRQKKNLTAKRKTSRQKGKPHGKKKNLAAKRKRLTAKIRTSRQKEKDSRQK